MMMKKLSEKTWSTYPLATIFTVDSGVRLTTSNKVSGKTPFIGATDNSNGVTGFISNTNKSLDNHVLGVNYNGAPGIAFYHPYKAIFSDDVKRLHLKHFNANTNTMLFMKEIIMKQRFKYSYGYKFKADRMLRQKLNLPVTSKNQPDYPYMEQYVKLVKEKLINRYKSFLQSQIALLEHVDIPELADKKWKKYNVFGQNGILKIETSQSSIDKNKLKEGTSRTLPYITRSNMNNGIANFVSSNNSSYGLNSGKCITIGLDTQTAFWQDTSFVTGQNIQIIEGTNLNKFSAHFIIPLLLKQMKAKFNWGGNGATLTRMKRISILLPIDNNRSPDYQYMEQYVKNLMLKKYQQYLVFLNNSEL
nr:restriction endonuclease subunit S [Lactiplantibacillus plantarum]